MKICSLSILTALIAMSGGTHHVRAQEHEDEPAITARVHGTFVDRAAGLGVLSGDMTIVRFEVRNRTITAIGRIVGALADSGGDVLGPVDQELAVAVGNIESTCNQLRTDLAAMDAEVLDIPVHFDGEVAGFDSRDGGVPKALGPLCTAGKLLESKPTPDAVARALNDVVVTLKAASVRKM
jgi:hypothetical protein